MKKFPSQAPQAPQQSTIANMDPCKEHYQCLKYISLNRPNRKLSIKGCEKCKQERKNEQFVEISEIKNILLKQEYVTNIELFKSKLDSIINQTAEIQDYLKNQMNEIYEIILDGINELFAKSICKQLPNNIFSFADIFDLVSKKTMEDFQSIIDQQVQLQKADEISASLFSKILLKYNESNEFLNCIKLDNNIKILNEKIKNQVNQIKNSITQNFNSSKKFINIAAPEIISDEPALHFLQYDFQDQSEQIIQHIEKITTSQPIKLEKDEQLVFQIKQIVDVDDKTLCFSSSNQIFLCDKNNNFKCEKQIKCSNDVSALCALTLNNKLHLCACVEENEQQFQLQFWDWQTFEKIKVINAHNSYIWQIINLPKGMVATCSEDTTIKVFNCQNSKLISTIAVHQASVNDIALLNAEILISVSDDGLVAASTFLDGDQKGMAIQDGEIKCVIVLDGCRFVTGNSKGDINIYQYHDQTIELLKAIEKIHKADVRFLSRIDQILFVSSSFDGTHKFFNVMGEQIKSIEGPKKNFSEPLLWVKSQQCLVASSKGILHRYK